MFSYTNAQDVHYTQQFDNDIYLNPAQSGLGNKANRLVFQYRDQWRTVPVPFSSTFISYDRRLMSKNSNVLGGGVQLLYDRSGDGHLSTIKASVSPAYTRMFKDDKLGLSIGVQVGMVHRFVDVDALIFESQYDGVDVNPGSGEALSGSVTALDLGAGLQFSAKIGDKEHEIKTGFSAYNLNEPNLSFVENGSDPRPMRYNAYITSEIFVGQKWSLNPVFEYQRQEKLDNMLPILYAKRYLKEEKRNAISFGGGYRVDDAAMIYVAYEIKDFKIGLNYDINTSSFNDATNSVGAGEILLKYEWERKKKEIVEVVIDTVVVEDSVDIVEEIVEEEEEEEVVEVPIVEEVEEEEVAEEVVEVPEPTMLEDIANGINIKLFFPNDYPDPKSFSTTTKTTYEEIYRKYMRLSLDYYSKGGEEGNMYDFIDNSVIAEWKRFTKLMTEVRAALREGKSVTIDIRGYTSPIATGNYNLNLSKRRVQSIINQMNLREDMNEYLDNGQLKIIEQPYGETKANDQVSDDKSNVKKSIYSDKASFERRIEIEKVVIE